VEGPSLKGRSAMLRCVVDPPRMAVVSDDDVMRRAFAVRMRTDVGGADDGRVNADACVDEPRRSRPRAREDSFIISRGPEMEGSDGSNKDTCEVVTRCWVRVPSLTLLRTLGSLPAGGLALARALAQNPTKADRTQNSARDRLP
ncbi:hypothetical protein THAOC_23364, partial [Thalassiosira oceanica]